MIVIAALYRFTFIQDLPGLKKKLDELTKENNIFGTLLIAHEGINGTVSGSRQAIDELKSFLFSKEEFNGIEYKESFHEKTPFYRMKVIIKKQILNLENARPHEITGTYVDAKKWNELLMDDDVTVIDVRNDYEVKIGTFINALDPKTENFKDFADFVKNNLDPKKNKKIAMSCTGGIRCEKASSFMKIAGFEEVYHLKGGVLQYLEDVNKLNEQNLWQGECFVFDQRISVDKDLKKGKFGICYSCKLPLNEEEMQSPHYEAGVACEHCFDKRSSKQQQSARERQKQIILAKEKGLPSHLGPKV